MYQRKINGECQKLYIYTNNQCSSNIITLITQFIENKLQTDGPLFDKIIHAFKINNKIVEIGRTTHYKTYNDFIKCTLLPRTTEICFIDNTYFPDMVNEHVYYIHPKAFIHRLSKHKIMERLLRSDIGKYYTKSIAGESMQFDSFMYQWIGGTDADPSVSNDIGELISEIKTAEKIMYHLKEFFFRTRKGKQTRKMRKPYITPLNIYNGTPEGRPARGLRATLPINELHLCVFPMRKHTRKNRICL